MATNKTAITITRIDGDIDTIIEVGKAFAKGRSPKAVVAELGLSSVQEAKKMYEQYKQLAIQSAKGGDLGDRLALALEESLQHFEILLEEAWENKEDATANLEFSTVNTSLRLIKDITESRFKMLQSMVDGQDIEMLEELEYMEGRQEKLLSILKELKEQFPDAAKFIGKKLQEVEGVEIVG